TIYFGNPAHLSVRNSQLSIKKYQPEEEHTIPIEDIGLIVADHKQVTFTHTVITSLQANNAAILWCGDNHMPLSLTLPLYSNDTFSEKVRYQVEASEPLKKQLWKQTVAAKIKNQAWVLQY